MPQKRRRFSPEYREEAVKMVIDPPRPIAQVARELGLNEATLGNWVNTWKKEHPDNEETLTLPERARLRELERENRELRMHNDFLKKSCSLLRLGATVSDKYRLVDAERADFPVVKMCEWLGVSKSG